MRRSSERGWIAKAYPDAFQATSQTELELMEDDISDCDSFFDDDFDMETKDEKLGMLLSCNTLGVESKVRPRGFQSTHMLTHVNSIIGRM